MSEDMRVTLGTLFNDAAYLAGHFRDLARNQETRDLAFAATELDEIARRVGTLKESLAGVPEASS